MTHLQTAWSHRILAADYGGLVYPGIYAIDATWAPTVAEAMRVLHQDGTAIIPERGWEEMAHTILGLLGETPEHVRSVLHRALIYQRSSVDPAEGLAR